MSAPSMERMGVRGASMPHFPRWHQFGKPNDGSFQVCALFREKRDADLFGAAPELLERLRQIRDCGLGVLDVDVGDGTRRPPTLDELVELSTHSRDANVRCVASMALVAIGALAYAEGGAS